MFFNAYISTYYWDAAMRRLSGVRFYFWRLRRVINFRTDAGVIRGPGIGSLKFFDEFDGDRTGRAGLPSRFFTPLFFLIEVDRQSDGTPSRDDFIALVSQHATMNVLHEVGDGIEKECHHQATAHLGRHCSCRRTVSLIRQGHHK